MWLQVSRLETCTIFRSTTSVLGPRRTSAAELYKDLISTNGLQSGLLCVKISTGDAEVLTRHVALELFYPRADFEKLCATGQVSVLMIRVSRYKEFPHVGQYGLSDARVSTGIVRLYNTASNKLRNSQLWRLRSIAEMLQCSEPAPIVTHPFMSHVVLRSLTDDDGCHSL